MSESTLSPRQKQIIEHLDAWQAIIKDEPHWTFGDLEKGDQFVSFPLPGDNLGHGGFLHGGFIFMKIEPFSMSSVASVSVMFNCVRMCDRAYSHNPDDIPVIRLL